jgi:hypothetical protein
VKRKRTPSTEVKSDKPVPEGIAPDALVPEVVVAPALIEKAKRAIEPDRLAKPARCSVCGEDRAPTSTEGLCWVCRRLKLSAWRDTDTQMPAQE